MKQNKIFCIDEELIKKLNGLNASELVNRLLINHFQGDKSENLAYLKQKFNENRLILREIKRKDKDLRQKIKRIELKEIKIIKQNYDLEIWSKAKAMSKTKMIAEIKQIYAKLVKGGEQKNE